MAEDADNRTEAPTPRRLERAAREGEAWQPRELSPALALALAVAAGSLVVAGTAGWGALAAYLETAIAGSSEAAFSANAAERALFAAPVAVVLFVAGAAAAVQIAAGLVVGRGWNGARLMPKFGRLSPIAGIKRLVSREGLIGALLALAKLAAFGVAAWVVFAPGLAALLRLDGDIAAAGPALAGAVKLLTFVAAGGLALIGAVEGVTSFLAFQRKLRMSPEEVRREQRQENGSPEMKAAIRRSQLATASRRMRTTLKEATVVVVNPTHFAVAMRYRPGADAAPVLLEKGRELTAQAIIDVARELAIPIVRAPRLARAVFFTGRIGEAVREELFGAVAIVIAYVLSFDADAELPPIIVPPAFDFDTAGVRRKPGTPLPL